LFRYEPVVGGSVFKGMVACQLWKPPPPRKIERKTVVLKSFCILAAMVLLATTGKSINATQTRPEIIFAFAGTDGGLPQSDLVKGNDGLFYGTTGAGGTHNTGTVFKITTAGTLTTVYNFTGGPDGCSPRAGVIQGSDGLFYGTASGGGTNGFGTVYQVSSNGAFTTLYTFTGGVDGGVPDIQLVEGNDGLFYGTTVSGGVNGTGSVFTVSSAGAFTTLFSFNGTNGASPAAGLVQGSDSNFYGTTFLGGTNTVKNNENRGTVFQITPAGTLTTLFQFTGNTNNAFPEAQLIQGSDGLFYGTTSDGNGGNGSIFKITTAGTLTTLHTFAGGEGKDSRGALVQGRDSFFYGMTLGWGNRYGTVYQVTSNSVFTTLYSFNGATDGGFPYAGLIQGDGAFFYGTTAFGGSNLNGTVFRFSIFPAGTYNGLVIQTNAPTLASSGSITLVLTTTGSFTGKLTLGSVFSSFKGQFDETGNATNMVVRKNLNPLQVILQVSDAGGTNQVIGTVSDGVFTSQLLTDLGGFGAGFRCPFAGKFTFVVPPVDQTDPNFPQGYGYGTLTVSRTGKGSLRGVLGDGTKISSTAPVSLIGTWPFYNLLYSKNGFSLGRMVFTGTNVIDAALDWQKPPIPADRFNSGGFTTLVSLAGAAYLKPNSSTNSVGLSVAGTNVVTLGGGNLVSNIVKTVVIDALGNVTILAPGSDQLAVFVVPTSGQFGGSFIDAAISKTPIFFNGELVQTNHFGGGLFLGTNESGFVTIEPTP
jgi:uncharacterized repeat protein (TIGR03803 family)